MTYAYNVIWKNKKNKKILSIGAKRFLDTSTPE